MLGKIEVRRRRGRQRVRGLDGITEHLNGHEFAQTPGDGEGRGRLGMLQSRGSQSRTQLDDWAATTDQPHVRPCPHYPSRFLLSQYVLVLKFLPHDPDTGGKSTRQSCRSPRSPSSAPTARRNPSEPPWPRSPPPLQKYSRRPLRFLAHPDAHLLPAQWQDDLF